MVLEEGTASQGRESSSVDIEFLKRC